MDNKESLGSIIKTNRVKIGWSQTRLGRELVPECKNNPSVNGIDRKTIAGWENGSHLPNAETLLKLSEVLKVDLSAFTGKDVTISIIQDRLGIDEEFQDLLKGFVFEDEGNKRISDSRLEFLKDFIKSDMFDYIWSHYSNYKKQIKIYQDYQNELSQDEPKEVREYSREIMLCGVNELRRRIVLAVAEALERFQCDMIHDDALMIVPSKKLMERIHEEEEEV